MDDLPESIQSIVEREKVCPAERWVSVPHFIQFVYGPSMIDATSLALFESEGPLPFPNEGQVTAVHGIDVRVVQVVLRYDVEDKTGAPSVLATVRVEPLESQ